MKDVKGAWKELKQRGEDCEDAPLTKSKATSKVPSSKPDLEDDFWDTGFTLREIKPQAIRAWMVFQVVSLFFEVMLWSEVSEHLSEFEDTIMQQCSGPHLKHGVCIGPTWNVSAWEDTTLGTGVWQSTEHRFSFKTASSPPTFLIVVDPVTAGGAPSQDLSVTTEKEDDGARWSLELTRTDPPQVSPAMRKSHIGPDAITVEDLSIEAKEALAARGKIEWRATLTSRMGIARRVRFVMFVEDATAPHLAAIHANPQCTFSQSWKAFNMQRQGHGVKCLSWCRLLLGIFVFVGGSAVYVVHAELKAQAAGKSDFRFHIIVVAKFLLQDVPQQLCIVLYLFGWYEYYGLRCQFCLFHPEHCGYENPFHTVNLVALTCTLLSSLSNQLLIRPVFKKVYTEDDICIQYCLRIGGICLSTLPFTSGMCWASANLVPFPRLTRVLFVMPCAIGWVTLAIVVCLPVLECCEDDYDF